MALWGLRSYEDPSGFVAICGCSRDYPRMVRCADAAIVFSLIPSESAIFFSFEFTTALETDIAVLRRISSSKTVIRVSSKLYSLLL